MYKVILINSIIPIIYFILIILMRLDLIRGNTRVLIAEYGAGLLIIQLIISILVMIRTSNKTEKAFVIFIFILFSVALFKTIEKFNPV